MQPECIQVYVLSTDYPVFHSWLLSKKEKKKRGENWSATVPPLGEAEYCSCNKALTHSTLINR